VGHDNPALGHHGHKISVAQPVGDVPAKAQFNGLALEPAAAVERVSHFRLGHSALLCSYGQEGAPKCTRTLFSHFLLNQLI
jgi:hypothetical protein